MYLIVFQLIERTAVDHPHHTLFILFALANAEKDDKYLTAGKKNAASKLTRNNSKGGAKGFTEVFNLSYYFYMSLEGQKISVNPLQL